ncbi:hypothetical protein HQ535_04890 [bacterium]|nr:hypothetical protein [bacterium]
MSVKVSCDRCGPLELGEWEIAVVWCGPDGEGYSFVCPGCDAIVHRAAPPRVLRLLSLVGARETVARITEDEISFFADSFDDEAVWAELA